MNIPIYRAKRLDNSEYMIIKLEDFFNGDTMCIRAIDKKTLAIHFPDMLDKNGKPIFASLSEDGKGGDALENIHYDIRNCIVLSGCCGITQGINNVFIPFEDLDTRLFKVIEICEG